MVIVDDLLATGGKLYFVSYIIHVYTACADPENFSSGKGKARDKNLFAGGRGAFFWITLI